MLHIHNLSFSYAQKNVLQDISFYVERGDFWVILGPNGAGKSTLIKLLAGLLKASSGTISISGSPITSYSVKELSKKIAYIPQRQNVIFDFTLFDMVLMGRNPYHSVWRSAGKEDSEIVLDAIEQTHLIDLKDKLFAELSGGEQQRTLLARAMSQQAEIMLLDEPLTNLDIVHQYEILDILTKLNQKQKITVVMVLHDIALTKNYAQQVLLLKKGKNIASGQCEDVFTSHNIRTLFDIKSHIANQLGI